MALCKAVQFRFLHAQLTKPERSQFLCTLQNINVDIIASALFHCIMHGSPNNQPEAEEMNTLMSNIILSRKKEEEQDKTVVGLTDSPNIKLDCMPKRLVGEISSFLSQSDYINLSKTNRFIFTGCNSPNQLQTLQLTEINNYSAINLELYPSVRQLSLNMSIFNQLMPQIARPSVLNQLEFLLLSGAFQSDYDIDMFLNHNPIDTNNVTQLIYSGISRSFPIAKMVNILTKFHNIQHLGLYTVQHVIDIELLKQTYTDLKGLSLIISQSEVRNGLLPWYKSLVDTFGSNLESLCLIFQNSNAVSTNFGNVNFSKLEEVEMSRVPVPIMRNIFRTTKNLKRTIIWDGDEVWNPIDAKELMTRLVSSNKSLEHVSIRLKQHSLESVLSGIEDGLFQTKQWTQNNLTIILMVSTSEKQFIPAQYKVPIQKVIFWLKLRARNFVFLLSFFEIDAEINVSTMLGQQLISSDDSDIQLINYGINGKCQFGIRNVGCNICGITSIPIWKMRR
eukprot:840505_1